MARSTLRGVALLIVTLALSVWVYDRSSSPQQPGSVARAVTAPPSASDRHMRVQLRAWLTASEPAIDALVIARNNIATAADQHDIGGAGAACRTARGAVANLHRQLPSPDPMLNNQFLQVISDYDVGLPYCISGAGMQQAAAYITAADAALHAAFDILGQVPGCEPREAGVLIV